ncbi:Epidermal retinol dehydrogenase 2-like protein [Aphelenchoides fujianensis]|nr:Epidermal retinol dehydrogenase 2-like protein [Aphelenchoides fujianensis]
MTLSGMFASLAWSFRLLAWWTVDSLKALLPLSLWPKKKIQGQLVLITGGGGGIGRCLATEFGKRGCRLVLWDVNEQKLEEAQRELRGRGFESFTFRVDVSKKEEVYENARLIKKQQGDVDILVNCAGGITNYNFLEMVDEAIEACIGLNLLAHFYTLHAFLPAMQARNRGHIVAISSYFGFFGSGPFPEYATTKFGINGMMESLRLHLAHEKLDGVKTLLACPAYTSTPIMAGFHCGSWAVPQLTAEYVAGRIVEAVEANKPLLITPRGSIFLNFLHQIAPTRVADQLNLMSDEGYKIVDHFVRLGAFPPRRLAPSGVGGPPADQAA